MIEVELELTYLVKTLPDLTKAPSKLVVDVYFPLNATHSCLRLRQNGDQFEITKKIPVDGADSSHQHEHTIKLTQPEFTALAVAPGKRVVKRRYFYDFNGRLAEIDVFEENLKGLVLADFEFKTREEQAAFKMPDFCLADVTQDEAVAGGYLAGKSYADVAPQLAGYWYKPL